MSLLARVTSFTETCLIFPKWELYTHRHGRSANVVNPTSVCSLTPPKNPHVVFLRVAAALVSARDTRRAK